MAVLHFTKTGTKSAKKTSLPKEIFALEVQDHGLIKQAYLSTLAGKRSGSSRTKNRSEVRGGGRKPWRQKGTGRARAGSIRSPIWRGGGITFGPNAAKNYGIKVNKSARKKALAQALSLKSESGSVVLIEAFPGHSKTRDMAAFISKVAGGKPRTLLVAASIDDKLRRSCHNLPGVEVKTAAYLSVPDVIDADVLLIESQAIEALQARLGSSA